MKKKHFLGAANYLTYGRIASVPVFIVLMSFISPASSVPTRMDILLSWVALILMIITGFTDVIDGYLARRGESTGSFGKFIDPLADKLFTAAILIMLIPLERIAAWVVVVLLSREIAVTALRGMAVSEGIEIAASQWGKRKTVMEHFALGALLLYYPIGGVNIHLIGQILIGLTLIIALGSGIHYTIRFFQEVLERQKP